jgi:hypothetical protein
MCKDKEQRMSPEAKVSAANVGNGVGATDMREN